MPTAQRRRREKERDVRKKDVSLPAVLDAEAGIEPYRAILARRRKHERLTLEEREAIRQVVALCDGNAWRAAKLLEGLVSVQTVWEVLNEDEGAFLEVRAQWKQEMARNLQRVAHRMGEKLAEAVEVQTPSVRDLSIALGVVVDKTGVLAGDGITVNHVHRMDERAVDALADRVKTLVQSASTVPEPEEIEAEWTVTKVT